MNHLVPCPECRRHVRVREAACPFCGVELHLAATPPPVLPTRRLGRAALFAFGATLATNVVVTGCGGDTDDGGNGGAGGSSAGSNGGNAGSGGSAGSAAASGSSSTGGSSTGGSGGSGGSGAVGPVYGLPADASTSDAPAAGGTFNNDGGAMPLYGAAP
jgi:hypothetical protein